jgi:hypothetical protein
LTGSEDGARVGGGALPEVLRVPEDEAITRRMYEDFATGDVPAVLDADTSTGSASRSTASSASGTPS